MKRKMPLALWAVFLTLLMHIQPLYATQESEEEESSSGEMDKRLLMLKTIVRNGVAKAEAQHESVLNQHRMKDSRPQSENRNGSSSSELS